MKTTLKIKVMRTLQEDPETRNNDVLLTIAIWKKYYPDLIRSTKNWDFGVYLSDMFKLPREDHIKRIRAKIQNEEYRFIPTDEKVAKQRKLNIERWREALRYSYNQT